eukprot:TRINITY_DN36152_c0_g1_i1.p1 TRINITY_DN36152_c0_g1~~TRINITY_DN36152_c0_g1_i1.p1  ORF type:complete len:206 (+),score=14.41 TRINITY_DN36152_c0_g1_i1:46-663(+)
MELMERKPLKILCLSDTHNNHRNINIPNDVDLLIHAGDFTKFGKDEHATDFNLWLSEIPIQHKIVVVGNHECSNLRPPKKFQSAITNAKFLWQESVHFEGWKIFGATFFWPMKEDDTNPYYDQIPDDVNILIIHGPPLGIQDGGLGCPVLLNRIKELTQLKLVVFGHVHRAHGVTEQFGITFVNAAMCGSEGYTLKWDPITVDIK